MKVLSVLIFFLNEVFFTVSLHIDQLPKNTDLLLDRESLELSSFEYGALQATVFYFTVMNMESFKCTATSLW